ncbi:hypothetical protein RUM43_009962 [Polyplax serrata]|uniref:RWD domain-containing protein n=1 Tax=Polyplax serrata TaxID=468196 RepID=A0AAN8NZP0_POLSC
MDYVEEQNTELEALESIYCGELDILGSDPHSFSIKVKSEEYDGDKPEGLACTIKFTFTPKYPEELPLIEILEVDNFGENDEADLEKKLLDDANENLNMAMIFTLVSTAQEWLNNKWDEVKRNKELEAEKRLKEVEEEELKRFEGTRVTVESFLNWKMAFDEELGLLKKGLKEDKDCKKLTGKELFLQDKTLIESDLKFLEDSGETVKVDESLFQDLDDLDLDENEFSDD